MNELKTIEDIEYRGISNTNKLRQEAIKWYKHYLDDYGNNPNAKMTTYIEVVTFIKNFFNLTEEDLKEEQ